MRRRVDERQLDGDDGALAEPALYRHFTDMQRHEALHDRKAETGPFVTALIGLAALEERRTDALEIVGRNADAGVADAQRELRARHRGGHRNLAAALGELDGVGDEIEHDLLEGPGIAGHDRQILRRVGDEVDAVLPRLQRQQIAAMHQRGARRERLRRNLEIARFHLRHVEDAVDDRQQMQAGIVDELGVFPALGRTQHQSLLLRDHLGEADDGIERRAQLVAHGGEETRLGGIGRFRSAAGLIERLFGKLAIGDVAHHADDFGLARGITMRPRS